MTTIQAVTKTKIYVLSSCAFSKTTRYFVGCIVHVLLLYYVCACACVHVCFTSCEHVAFISENVHNLCTSRRKICEAAMKILFIFKMRKRINRKTTK